MGVSSAALAKAKELRAAKKDGPKLVKGTAKKTKKSTGTYDKNAKFTCTFCKPHKTITGPWSFKQHQIKVHGKTPEQVGLNPRTGKKSKK